MAGVDASAALKNAIHSLGAAMVEFGQVSCHVHALILMALGPPYCADSSSQITALKIWGWAIP